MFKSKMLFAPIVFAVFALNSFAQTTTPLEAVNSFYRFDKTHSQDFTRANIDARRSWFSSDLYSLFLKEIKRADSYAKKHPTDKPYFEGLPFQPIDETCKAGRKVLHKGVNTMHGTEESKRATILASFAFPKPCKNPDNTVYTIVLTKNKSGWLIDDVLYEDNHSLRSDLNRKDH
ncbi:MAG: hypothetical protein ABI999_03595 [Acidobacteriota bacterium]